MCHRAKWSIALWFAPLLLSITHTHTFTMADDVHRLRSMRLTQEKEKGKREGKWVCLLPRYRGHLDHYCLLCLIRIWLSQTTTSFLCVSCVTRSVSCRQGQLERHFESSSGHLAKRTNSSSFQVTKRVRFTSNSRFTSTTARHTPEKDVSTFNLNSSSHSFSSTGVNIIQTIILHFTVANLNFSAEQHTSYYYFCSKPEKKIEICAANRIHWRVDAAAGK